MKTSLLSLMLLVLPVYSGLQAQNGKSIPGYFGARNAVSFVVSPNVSLSERLFDRLLNPYLGVNLERAINRRSSINIGFGTNSSWFNGYDYYRFTDYAEADLYLEGNSVGEFSGKLFYSNHYFSVSKSFYFLGAGSIAPQGKYFKMGLNWNFYKITKDQMGYYVYSKSKTYSNPDSDFKTRTLGSFNMELGSKRFIGKNLFLQTAIAFNTPLNFWSTESGYDYRNINDFNESFIGYKLGYIQTCNISVSLGYAFK